MAVIKDNYLFPIYCDNAIPIDGEKNFHATGADIVDTIEGSDLFVKKAGDTMFGDLIMEGVSVGVLTNRIDTNNDLGIRIAVNNDQYFQLNNNFIIAYKPVMTDIIIGRTGDVISCSNDRLADVQDPVEDQDAVNKRTFDDAINILQNEVIELEEELEAIAPSTSKRGNYYYQTGVNTANTVPDEKHFYMIAEDGTITDDYLLVKTFVIHNTNVEDYTHTWAEVQVGNIIQFYDKPDEDVGVGTIIDIDRQADHVRFEVLNMGGSGSPGNKLDDTTGEYLVRLRIFLAPGQDSGDFLFKTTSDKIGLQDDNDITHKIAVSAGSDIHYYNFELNSTKDKFQIKDASGTSFFRAEHGKLILQNVTQLGNHSTHDINVYGKFKLSNSSYTRLYAYKDSNDSSLSYGEAGQVLTSNANSGPPYWATPADVSVSDAALKTKGIARLGQLHVQNGTVSTSDLAQGQIYYNSSDKTVRIGIT